MAVGQFGFQDGSPDGQVRAARRGFNHSRQSAWKNDPFGEYLLPLAFHAAGEAKDRVAIAVTEVLWRGVATSAMPALPAPRFRPL
jgi:hypothetical protein